MHKLIYEIKLVCHSDYQRKHWKPCLEKEVSKLVESMNTDAQKKNIYNSISFKFKGYED